MSKQFFENWSTQFRKGMLEFCILNSIRGTSLYGYDIVRTLRQIEGLVISEGTIYPILSRLKRDGLVETNIRESTQGPARKYYQLTRDGESMLDEMNRYWQVIKDGTDSVIKERKK